jgi:hypothetical protein
MNTLDQQNYEIVIYTNRKRLIGITSLIMLIFLLIVGMDLFAIWAFWNHYDIDTGAYVAAFILLISTLFIGLVVFVAFYTLCQSGPAFTINSQGFFFYSPLCSGLLSPFKPSFIPWEEIEWIASRRGGIYTWLALSLKDPAHYWSLYRKGPFRKWNRDPLTGAHINIAQYLFSLSARQIIQQIEENYRSELLTYEVKVIH